MTDEFNNPIDQPTETPADAPVFPEEVVVEADASEIAPTATPAESDVAPVDSPEAAPVETPEAAEPTAELEPEPVSEPVAAPEPEEVEADDSHKMEWYILKVQSNREDSIREGLLRRVAIAGLGEYFGDVIVPIEKVTEVKGGKKRIVKRKLYPGYLMVQMAINDDTWFLVRETPGIGDFTGAAGRPSMMFSNAA